MLQVKERYLLLYMWNHKGVIGLKYVKVLMIGIVISLVCQFSGLYYIDKYYLKTETSFKAKKVEKPVVEDKSIDITIPNDAKMIQVSNDAKYLSYCLGGDIRVINIINGIINSSIVLPSFY